MAKQRIVNTKFWSDPFVQNLETDEKLVYLYLITNERTSICGIYEITEKTISFDTGVAIPRLRQIVNRLYKMGKLKQYENWVYLTNFAKHQKSNPSVIQGIERAKKELPEGLLDRLGTDWVQPDTLELELEPELKPKGILSSGEDDGLSFEKFWEQYPRHEKKKEAGKVWSMLGVDKKQSAIANLPRLKSSSKWKQGFIPHPTTYLRGERWEDEGIPTLQDEKFYVEEFNRLGFAAFANVYDINLANKYSQYE